MAHWFGRDGDPRPERRILLILTAGFFATGVTALCAEVVANRLLRYVFGASHAATATVLAAYMSGLSAGAWLFGRLAARVRRRIAAYAYLELAVALCYLAMPAAYGLFSGVSLEAARALTESPLRLALARFALSFTFVFVPTLFMGGTLPILLEALRSRDAIGRELPRLYAANTLGAAAGTLLSTYLFVPFFGLDGALRLCAAINGVVAVLAFVISHREERHAPTASAPAAALEGAEPVSTGEASLPASALLPLAFAQGALVFALEVVWTHLVGTVIGVTVHAFGIMLAAILLGIGLGSALLPRLRRATALPPAALFVLLEAGICLAVLLTLPLWDQFPTVVYLTGWLKAHWSFGEREVVRFAFALLLMLPVTLSMGAALPALAAAGPRAQDSARFVGRLFAVNTMGAIAGSLFTSFVLLGRIPSEVLLKGCAWAWLGICGLTLVLLRGGRGVLARPLAACALTALVATTLLPHWNRARLTAGSHYSWSPWSDMRYQTTYFREDAQVGFVSVEKLPNGVQVMWTNGKYEGSDARLEFQDNLALVGGIYVRHFDRAFLLGLGPGRALAMLHEMPFRAIDVAELSPAVLQGARESYPSLVARPLLDPRVRVFVDDGRNRLQVAREPYDLVVVAISSAAFAGSGSIYNRDFFEIARAHLRPDGILMLWLQFHSLPTQVLGSVLHTLRSVFAEVHVYSTLLPSQGFLIASMRPLAVQRQAVASLDRGERARGVLAALGWHSVDELVAWSRLTSHAELSSFLREIRPDLYTDFYPAFEYAAPRGLALVIEGHELDRWSARRLPSFEPPLSAGEAAGLLGLRLQVAGDHAAALRALLEAERLLGRSRFSAHLSALRHRVASDELRHAPRPQ